MTPSLSAALAALLLAAPSPALAAPPDHRPAAPPEGEPARASRPDRADAPGPPPPPVNLGGGYLRLDGEQAARFRRPEPEDPGCLAVALQRRPAAAGLDTTVKFAVRRDGSVSHFTFTDPVAREAERAVVEAFGACAWRPGLDPAGEPLAVWVVQPIKVAPLPPPPPRARPLFD